jgi:hypothetical protein
MITLVEIKNYKNVGEKGNKKYFQKNFNFPTIRIDVADYLLIMHN